MTQILSTIFRMSFSACWIVLAVVLLRLLLKGAPKSMRVLLWIPVALRLCLPFSINSIYSLLPQSVTAPAAVTRVTAVGTTIASAMDTVTAPSVQAGLSVKEIAAIVWGVGMALMLGYMLICHIRLHRKLRQASPLWRNIYTIPGNGSAFVYGVFRPRIYLPDELDEIQAGHVIAHEQAHINRKDHWWKLLGFMVLTVHWFNPFVWLAYALLCRDLELACDERVIRTMSNREKAEYSEALLLCSLTPKGRASFPVAFSKISVKNRIKAIVNYKKPTLWVSLVLIVAIAVLSICFLTDPVQAQQEILPPVTTEQSSAAEDSAVVQRPDVAPEPEPGIPAFWITDPPESFEDVIDHYASVWGVSEHGDGTYFHAYKTVAQRETKTEALAYVALYSIYCPSGGNMEERSVCYLKVTSEIVDGRYLECNVTSNPDLQMLAEIQNEFGENILASDKERKNLEEELAIQCRSLLSDTMMDQNENVYAIEANRKFSTGVAIK